MKNSFSILTIIIISLAATTVWSQDKPLSQIIKTTIPDNPVVGINNDELVKELNDLKSDPSVGGSVKDQFRMKHNNAFVAQGNLLDLIQTTIATENNHFKSHYVVTEQSGNNAGTLWVVAVLETSGGDKIGIYRYEQTGWVLKTYVYTFKNLRFSIDAEVIETTAGNKALWITTDYIEAITLKSKVLVIGLNLNNLAEATIMELFWPGGSANSYYNTRMTTDNGVDGDFPYIYLVASVDSITTDNKHVNAQKFAYIDNPWEVTSPNINYRSEILPVYWPNGGATETHFLYSDIAYVHIPSSLNRIIFTYSNVPDETKIWLSSCTITGANALFTGTISRGNNNKIINSLISSPGGENQPQLMVVFEENYNNSGDYDLYSAKSNDGGVNWEINQIDLNTSSSIVGKLVSRRAVLDEYYLSYLTGGQYVMSIKSNNNTGYYWDVAVQVNDATPTFNNYNSSVGFTNTVGERLTVWSRFDQPLTMPVLLIGSFYPNLPSGIEDEEIEKPRTFYLKQNYPNPFNPSTKISWQSPISSNTTIKVYDVLGNEVAVLVDEYKPAGSHEINFDASSLSSGVYLYSLRTGEFLQTKKMILTK